MLVVLIPAIGILLWIAVLVAALVLVGIIWVVLGLLAGLEVLTHRITGRKNAGRSKRNIPRVPPQRNAPRGPSGPKPPLKTAGTSPRNTPPAREQAAAETRVASDIWPKWTPSRRRDVDQELAHWQEQFDALNAPK
jgi:hypothetical protein